MLLPSPGHEGVSDAAEIDPTSSCCASTESELEPRRCAEAGPGPDVWRQIETELPFLRRTVRRWHREKADADDLV